MMCSCSVNISHGKIYFFLEWENTHLRQISVDYHTKEGGSNEYLLLFQDNIDGKLHKQ